MGAKQVVREFPIFSFLFPKSREPRGSLKLKSLRAKAQLPNSKISLRTQPPNRRQRPPRRRRDTTTPLPTGIGAGEQ